MLSLLPRGAIQAIVIVGGLAFVGAQYLPIYFNAWQFYDEIRQEVKFAGSSRRTVQSVEEQIIRLADEYQVPLEKQNLSVKTRGPFFEVQVRYAVPVDLRVYQHEVSFDWSLSGETFQ